jgi:hypothetical protein
MIIMMYLRNVITQMVLNKLMITSFVIRNKVIKSTISNHCKPSATDFLPFMEQMILKKLFTNLSVSIKMEDCVCVCVCVCPGITLERPE